jgi:hypothetical protein
VRDLRSYVVRVYRLQGGGAAGTVQEVSTGRTMPFRSMEELWQAIRSQAPGSGGGTVGRRRGKRATSDGPRSTQLDAGSEGNEHKD